MVTYLQLQFRLQLCILVFDFRQASSGRECPLCRQRHTPPPNPNPINDPNPKISKKQNDTGMKLNIELYIKVDFLETGAGL